ncbi:hypothetical protein PPL_10741 [Heterostelium album PN500]|uniref:Transmembrane protein 19 n=1 Tax=Heterostelium pallidum (strain ATCC 26659 / Pp 5 / PN500) TaxID=670386 RepID=D3BSB5_HETP5|nr:hypothetical protein PPL_10741 [Heterostelium album PN500]EFA75688.1 hypothetical protein PPL_10741 [Heterostelium album PN500]|eukprot:XP_020427822.1 hypothetical protein PPL_10741 [Heterostelium album PN500]
MNRITLLSETIFINAYEHSKSRLLTALIIVSLFAIHGYRKKSLSTSGVIAAWCVGMITCISSWSFAVSLLSFYFSSSYLTKYKASIKKKIEENHLLGKFYKQPPFKLASYSNTYHLKSIGGQRNYVQVLSNSLNAAVCGLVFLLFSFDPRITFIDSDYKFDAFLICAVVGHYAACNGDTWASELGILNKKKPILVTTLKPVPTGTNGGVSLVGILASIAGGSFIGIIYYFTSALFNNGHALKSQIPIIYLGTFAGLFGSLIDSLMGATLQYSGWNKKKLVVTNNPPSKLNSQDIDHICGVDLLDNHQVNFLSSLLISMICEKGFYK